MQSKRATVFSPGNILPERFVSTCLPFGKRARSDEIDRGVF
jgi:hypothetical protein